jgi:hypothetical protein
VPAWLATRPDTTLRLVRKGRAYAVLPGVGSYGAPGCSQTIEVVAPSGKTCGSSAFEIAPKCGTFAGAIDVGSDGTVVQEIASDPMTTATGHSACGWQWWPGFLR